VRREFDRFIEDSLAFCLDLDAVRSKKKSRG
jgi:hypothetical protein